MSDVPRSSIRRIGVEEEMLLIDAETGRLKAASEDTVASRQHPISDIDHELFLQQVETATEPCRSIHDLDTELRRTRRAAVASAHDAGAAPLAAPTPLLADGGGDVTPQPRFETIMRHYEGIGRSGIICGMHVHVETADESEAVGVVDRIQPWLPVLSALATNSPINYGVDTGYASWRSQVWMLWPTAGPTEPFGDRCAYADAVAGLVASSAASDEKMVYFDARPSIGQPTVEIRVFDVCTDVRDAVLLAALTRALVESAARRWHAGRPYTPWRVDRLRAARWLASRDGLSDALLDPVDGRRRPAFDVVGSLMELCSEALEDAGDLEPARDGTCRLLREGTGASRQRRILRQRGLDAVVDDLRCRTAESP